MEYQSLSKKTPTSIGIFVQEAGETLLKHKAFVEINELLLGKKEDLVNYTYSIYTDTNMLKTNVYLPILNTLYIGCKKNNIVISKDDDLWLKDSFSNNEYYCFDFDFTENMSVAGIKKISSIKEIV
jgi:hypothetical protein